MVFLHDKGIFGIFATEKNCFRKKIGKTRDNFRNLS